MSGRNWRFLSMLFGAIGALLVTAVSFGDDRAIGVKPSNHPAAEGRRWAFLVGINDYFNHPHLKFCRQDCRAIKDALVKVGRFDADNIVLLTDDAADKKDQPTWGQIYARLPQVLEVADPEDLVLVYLSGHGAQFEDEKDKRGYFIPLDGSGRQTCISLGWVNEQLEACKARQKVLILDACRNDVAEGGKATRSMEGAIVRDTLGKSFVTLFSCDAGQRSSEYDRGDNGVYTHFLLEGLAGPADKDGDGRVDLVEAHQYARTRTQQWGVRKGSPQSPMFKGELGDPIVLAYVKPLEPPRLDRPPVVSETEPQPVRPPPARLSANDTPADLPKTLTLDCGKGMKIELVLIPAGEFMMGSPDSWVNEDLGLDERPQHRVKISRPFYMGKYEVTQAQWEAVMGRNPSSFEGEPILPVDSVSWDDCEIFCRKLSDRCHRQVRLPTEAEWEYACRAGNTGRFSFGDSDNELGRYGWFGGNSEGKTHPVGGKRPNAWGLYDMHGNVDEWCSDPAHYFYKGAPTDGSAWTSGGDSDSRTHRGGSWNGLPGDCRSSYRGGYPPRDRSRVFGLRVVVPSSYSEVP